MVNLDKCPNCGASNERGADLCQKCRKSLQHNSISGQNELPSKPLHSSWGGWWRYYRQHWLRQDWRNRKTWRDWWKSWSWREWLIIIGVTVVILLAGAIEGRPSLGVDSLSGLPYCEEAELMVLAGASGVSVQNFDQGCALGGVTVTLNGKYKCSYLFGISGEPLTKPINSCFDRESGERFNPLTTVVVDCRVEIQKPRVYRRACSK